eukprot:scaffold113_cov339-Pavlova_lutheri.AAC.10
MAVGYFILEIIPSWSDLVEVVLVTKQGMVLEESKARFSMVHPGMHRSLSKIGPPRMALPLVWGVERSSLGLKRGLLRARLSRERYNFVVDKLLTGCERKGEGKTP